MDSFPLSLVCSGCGAEASFDAPFACPEARPGDDIDHLLTRVIDSTELDFVASADVDNPFLRFGPLTLAWQLARRQGWSEARLVALIEALDERVAEVDGAGFAETPLRREQVLADALGLAAELWVKDETRNVAGSHKARHLMGVMIYLQVAEQLGLIEPGRPLAISSCGNAALAAAVVAAAAQRTIDVFVPLWADAGLVERLGGLGARLHPCAREDAIPGDPCTLAFREAVARGAIPFSCQGSDNGLAIEGGLTLGYELVAAMAADPPDRIFIQVGGGALGSAVVQAWKEAKAWGLVSAVPRIHTVQSQNTAPLGRAYDRLVARIASELPGSLLATPGPGHDARAGAAQRAELLLQRRHLPLVAGALRHAATHRSHYMWPWEREPRSVAHGILDDETYDWMALVRGMLSTGGFPIQADESLLRESQELACRETQVSVDATGSAGLAGLMQLARQGQVEEGERCLVLFTGVDRNAETS